LLLPFDSGDHAFWVGGPDEGFKRILPARKDRPISVEIPRIETVADSIKAAAAIATAVAEGEHPDGGGRA
jgi:hypothetical protein